MSERCNNMIDVIRAQHFWALDLRMDMCRAEAKAQALLDHVHDGEHQANEVEDTLQDIITLLKSGR